MADFRPAPRSSSRGCVQARCQGFFLVLLRDVSAVREAVPFLMETVALLLLPKWSLELTRGAARPRRRTDVWDKRCTFLRVALRTFPERQATGERDAGDEAKSSSLTTTTCRVDGAPHVDQLAQVMFTCFLVVVRSDRFSSGVSESAGIQRIRESVTCCSAPLPPAIVAWIHESCCASLCQITATSLKWDPCLKEPAALLVTSRPIT